MGLIALRIHLVIQLAYYAMRALIVQKRFMKKHLSPYLEEAMSKNDGSLSEADTGKIRKYYAVGVPAVLGEVFGLLRGNKLTQKERHALTFLGAITGLYDDFFDEKHTPTDHIINLTKDPEHTEAVGSHEELFKVLYLKAIADTEHKELLFQRCMEVYNAQILSLDQASPGNDAKMLESVTFEKGGYSLLFYRSALANLASDAENELLYTLGATMQLENDLFDVYKDRESGIETLVTTADSIAPLRTLYNQMKAKTYACLEATDYPKKQKRRFKRFISNMLVRGNVCLDDLERAQASTNGEFKLHEYTRKQLICDLETRRNILSLLRYYVRE